MWMRTSAVTRIAPMICIGIQARGQALPELVGIIGAILVTALVLIHIVVVFRYN